MKISPGNSWGTFNILKKLGQGGTCEVFCVEEPTYPEPVALKILLENQNVLRFKREFRSMSRLDHPNIAKVYHFGEFDERVYYTMEFIRGGDLKTVFQTSTVDSDTMSEVPQTKPAFHNLVELLIEICEPLKYIHSKRIVHRDLKPANIMRTETGQVKLMDFGLIKEKDILQETLTQTGTFVGTVAYMSPEQGMGKSLDHRSDIYSLGVIFYEALAGRLPFIGASILQIFMKHINEPPVPPSEFNQNIPRELEYLVLRMLQKEPARRPSTVIEVSDELKQWLHPTRMVEPEVVSATAVLDFRAAVMDTIAKPVLFVPGVIGRDGVLNDLKSELEQVYHGQPHITMIEGETGIGKSFLLKEMVTTARLHGYSVLQGSSSEIDRFPYSVFLRPLESIADRLKGKDEEYGRHMVGRAGPIVASICPRFNELEWINRQPPPAKMEPLQEKLRVFDAIKSIFENIARDKITILTLEDLHWADDLSLELIHFLVRGFSSENIGSNVPLFILGALRAEEVKTDQRWKKLRRSLEQYSHYRNIVLGTFSMQSTEDLVKALLGSHRISPDIVGGIYKDSGGNPLFIEEIVKNLLEDEVLTLLNGEWVIDLSKTAVDFPAISFEKTSSGILKIPERIQNLIIRRLEKLDEETKVVLTRAAVIGIQFEYELLREVLQKDEDELLDLLDEALREDIIKEVSGSGGQAYRFRHQMICRVLYVSLQSRRKIRIHQQVANSIVKLYGEDSLERCESLAYHFDIAQEYNKAAHYYLKAANKVVTYMAQTTQNYAARVLDILPNATLTPEEYAQYYKEAHRLRGRSFEMTGHFTEALQEYELILEFGRKNQSDSEMALGYYYMGGILSDRGEYHRALDCFKKFLELKLENKENEYQRACAIENIAGILANLGQYQESIEAYHQVHKIMNRLDQISGLASSKLNVGMVYYYIGEFDQAASFLEEATKLYKQQNDQYRVAKALNNLAGIYQSTGQNSVAMQCCEESLDISRKIGDMYSIAAIQGNLGIFYLNRGQFCLAGQSLRESLSISRKMGDQTGIVTALASIGSLLVAQGVYESAESNFTEAMKRAEEMGARWLSAATFLEMGDMYLQKSDLELALSMANASLRSAESIGLKSIEVSAKANIALIHALNGELTKGRTLGVANVENATRLGDSEVILRSRYRLSDIYLLHEDARESRKIIVPALKLARKLENNLYQWRMYAQVGRSLFMEKRYPASFQAYRNAINLLLAINKQVESDFKKNFLIQEPVRAVFYSMRDLSCMLENIQMKDVCERILNI